MEFCHHPGDYYIKGKRIPAFILIVHLPSLSCPALKFLKSQYIAYVCSHFQM